jgi:hypothetical protein
VLLGDTIASVMRSAAFAVGLTAFALAAAGAAPKAVIDS